MFHLNSVNNQSSAPGICQNIYYSNLLWVIALLPHWTSLKCKDCLFFFNRDACCTLLQDRAPRTLQRLCSSIREAFSYGILRILLWFNDIYSMTLCFIESHWNMPYPVWKCLTYGTAQSLYNVLCTSVELSVLGLQKTHTPLLINKIASLLYKFIYFFQNSFFFVLIESEKDYRFHFYFLYILKRWRFLTPTTQKL